MAGLDEQDKVRAAFDHRATAYQTLRWHAGYAEQLVHLAGLEQGSTVLDAATGTGFAALAAARVVGSTGSVVGVDISSGMLAEARTSAAALGIDNVQFLVANATSLPQFPAASFDAVLCSASLLYMHADAALREWHRILRPSGLVGFSTMQCGQPPAAELFRECAREFRVELSDPSLPLGSERACRELLRRSGFNVLRIVDADVSFTADDLAAAWEVHLNAVGHDDVRSLSSEDLIRLKALYENRLHGDPTAERFRRAGVLYAYGRRN